MDVFLALKNEDDNPTGQASGRFLSGSSLDDAAEAEAKKKERKAQQWSLSQQEAGILDLIKARNYFERLHLPEPRIQNGLPVWDVPRERVEKAYESVKKCCHPDWAFHPKRERGYALLCEAVATLTDENGRRDQYVSEIAERQRKRQEFLAPVESGHAAGSSSGSGSGAPNPRVAAAAAAEAAAAELEAQLAGKRKRMLLESKLRRTTAKSGERRPIAEELNSDDEEDESDEKAGSSGGLDRGMQLNGKRNLKGAKPQKRRHGL